MSYDTASAYRRSGDRLDEHLNNCPTCSIGVACPDGDDRATSEYRAWREWQRDDPDGARAAQRDRRR
jgi:hypothetical protein